MTDESIVTQRGLVSRPLRLVDGELHTKYAFPFVDREWASPFRVLDVYGMGPRILHGPLELKPDGLHTHGHLADLQHVESVPLETVAGLVHFDPWWVFRGVSGVDRQWAQAVIATNIAHPFSHKDKAYKVHDLAFGAGLSSLTAVVAKDEAFHRTDFHKGEIDLLGLRKTLSR